MKPCSTISQKYLHNVMNRPDEQSGWCETCALLKPHNKKAPEVSVNPDCHRDLNQTAAKQEGLQLAYVRRGASFKPYMFAVVQLKL